VLGTPQYMAPEQIERPREVDHRADIYSLGVVFYQMLTGELPTLDDDTTDDTLDDGTDGNTNDGAAAGTDGATGGTGGAPAGRRTGRRAARRYSFAPPSRKVLIDVRLDEVVLRALQREPARRYQQVSEVRTHIETIVATGDVSLPHSPPRPPQPQSQTPQPPPESAGTQYYLGWSGRWVPVQPWHRWLSYVRRDGDARVIHGPILARWMVVAVFLFVSGLVIVHDSLRNSLGNMTGAMFVGAGVGLFLGTLIGIIVSYIISIDRLIPLDPPPDEKPRGVILEGAWNGRSVRGIVLVGTYDGRPVVNWPGVLLLVGIVCVVLFVFAAFCTAAGLTVDARGPAMVAMLALLLFVVFLWAHIRNILRSTPPGKLPPLSTPPPPGGDSPPPAEAPPIEPETAAQIDRARRAVRPPAIGMIVASAVNMATIIVLCTLCWMAANFPFSSPKSSYFITFLAGIAGLLLGGFMIEASVGMLKARSRAKAVVASIGSLLAVPAVLTLLAFCLDLDPKIEEAVSILLPAFLIGLPMGLWALVVLCRREMAEAFEVVKRMTPPTCRRTYYRYLVGTRDGKPVILWRGVLRFWAMVIITMMLGAAALWLVVPMPGREIARMFLFFFLPMSLFMVASSIVRCLLLPREKLMSLHQPLSASDPNVTPRFPRSALLGGVFLCGGVVWLIVMGQWVHRHETITNFFVTALGFAAFELVAMLLGIVAWRSWVGKSVALLSGLAAMVAIGYALAIGLPNVGKQPPVQSPRYITFPTPDWEARVGNGAIVQLLGLAEHPSADNPWWRPDGLSLSQRPYDKMFITPVALQSERQLEFAARLTNASKDASVRWEFQPHMGGALSCSVEGEIMPDTRAVLVTVPAKLQSLTVKVGVATGVWSTFSSCDGRGGDSGLPLSRAGDALFTLAAEQDGNVTLTVSHNMRDQDARLVAVDPSGQVIIPKGGRTTGIGNLEQIVATFTGVKLADIQEFRFQVRPYMWAEFQNVALRPAVEGPWTGQPPRPVAVPAGGSATYTLTPLVGEFNENWPCIDLDTGRMATFRQTDAWAAGTLFTSRIGGMPQSVIMMPSRAELREMSNGQDTSVLWNVSDAEAALALTEAGTGFQYPFQHAPYVLAYKTTAGQVGLIKVDTVSPEHIQLTVKPLASAESPAAAQPAFGPVVERTINDLDDGNGSEGLKLATGDVVSLPADVEQMSKPQRAEWIDEQGIDLFVDYARNQWAFIVHDHTLNAVDACFDDVSPAALEEALAASPRLETRTKDGWTIYILPRQAKSPLVFALRTKAGQLGVLEVTDFTENPKGMKIRYKLLPALAAAPPLAAAQPAVMFGPVVERVLPDTDIEGAEALFDLDMQRAMRHVETADNDQLQAWFVENGVDCAARVNPRVQPTAAWLACKDVAWARVSPEQWDRMTAAEAVKLAGTLVSLGWSDMKPGPVANAGEPSSTFVFRTREGGVGLLQLVTFSEDPLTLSIRYKLVVSAELHRTALAFLRALRDKDLATVKALSLGAELGWFSDNAEGGHLDSMNVRQLERLIRDIHDNEEVSYKDHLDLLTRVEDIATVVGGWGAVRIAVPPEATPTGDEYLMFIFTHTGGNWRFIHLDLVEDPRKSLAESLPFWASHFRQLLLSPQFRAMAAGLYTASATFERTADLRNVGRLAFDESMMILRLAGPLAIANALQTDEIGLTKDFPRGSDGGLTDEGQAMLTRLVRETAKNLRVKVDGSTDLVDVVTIEFSHTDPRVAEQFPTTLFTLYRDSTVNELSERLDASMTGLRKELEAERAKLKDASMKVARFEIDNKDVTMESPDGLQAKLDQLNKELDEIERALAEEKTEALNKVRTELNERLAQTNSLLLKIRKDYLALRTEEAKHKESVDRLEKQLAAVEADFKAEIARRRTMLRMVQPPQKQTQPSAPSLPDSNTIYEMDAGRSLRESVE